MKKETIVWHEWTEENSPPVDRLFLGWFGKSKDPWCAVLQAMDDEGHYFQHAAGDNIDPTEVTHWAESPKGPLA